MALLAAVGITGLMLPVLLGAIGGIGGLVLFCWGGTRIICHILHGDDPHYQEYLSNCDPWFDTLPPPFRSSPTKQSPYYCLRCHGDMWTPVGVCPHCGFGENEMVCNDCGTTVTQPNPNAFETTGVTCPQCMNVLRR